MRESVVQLASRRRFLGGLGLTVGMLAAPAALRGEGPASGGGVPAASGGIPGDWFPRQDPELVKRIVGVAHGDLDEVRRLVTARPELAKAQWDWGFGDWESPLDAASHTGRREIALLLLQHGARPTIFSAAMLGQLEVVKAFIAAAPGVQATPGPHGIPLLAHAKVGGEPAAAVVAYLEAVGGAAGPPATPLGEAAAARYLGVYAFGNGSRDRLEVTFGKFGLALARADGSARPLLALGGDAFHPAGAPSVRVRFEGPPERATTMAVHDAELVVRATRVAG